MIGTFFIQDDELLPIAQAIVPIDDINFCYGYGVYETMKVRKGHAYFVEMHEERLYNSAKIIELAHSYRPGDIVHSVSQLIAANKLIDANLKALLIGSPAHPSAAQSARLYIFSLNPLFPKRIDYKNGAHAITYEGERQFPQAKSLNMMMSVIAYNKAKSANAYDALLINQNGEVTEGTRTNFYVTDGEAIYTPPTPHVLAGVTRHTVNQVISNMGIALHEQPIQYKDIGQWKGAFLTSTSSKIMPLATIDTIPFSIPPLLRNLMKSYNDFLSEIMND